MSIKDFDLSLLGMMGDFAGIGSRKINKNQSLLQMKIGFFMALSGYKLNSGAADGSDTSFEFGYRAAIEFLKQNFEMSNETISKMMSVYLPWPGFNGRSKGPGYVTKESQAATDLTSKYHANWGNLKNSVRNLMSRNAMQILGEDLSRKVKFVICETPDGAFTASMTSPKTGGTGQAIRIADDHDVKVFNLQNLEHRSRLEKWVKKMESDFESKYGVNPMSFFEGYLDSYDGISNSIEGDLIDLANQGEIDVLVHGCNCQNVKGSGFAKRVFDTFPEAYDADQRTRKGDRKKLGTYSSARVQRNGKDVIIVNAYTQQYYGRDPDKLYVDYEAVRKVFDKIAKDFPAKRIAFPKIGAGLANGCWVTLSNIIKTSTRNMIEPMLVKFPGDRSYSLEKSDVPMDEFLLNVTNDDKFVFFWGQEDVFSNWHKSKFTDGVNNFYTGEQGMMYKKAMLMGDLKTAQKILNVPDGNPRTCKDLGQEVSPWNEDLWLKNREKIVHDVLVLKFSQNEEMLKHLLKTGNRIMVEASPYDKNWGIGIRETHKDAKNPSRWKGLNLLGKCLERARDTLINNPELLTEKGKEIRESALELGWFESKVDQQLSLIEM